MGAPLTTPWTPALIAQGLALWTAGHSASQVGAALGVSKNAVIGQAHRSGWPARPSPIGQQCSPIRKPTLLPTPALPRSTAQRRSQTAATVRAQPADGRPAPVAVEPEAPATVFRRRRPSPCLWTEGERGRFVFCDAPATVGRWCEAHSVRALAGATRDVFTPGGILVPAVVKPKVVVAKPPVQQKSSMRAIDLTGQRFGNLVVQSRAEIVAGQEAKWRCLCDCGQVSKSVRGSNLRSGNTMRCLACSVTAKRTRMRERNTAVVPEACA
jgi:hypothetical protein